MVVCVFGLSYDQRPEVGRSPAKTAEAGPKVARESSSVFAPIQGGIALPRLRFLSDWQKVSLLISPFKTISRVLSALVEFCARAFSLLARLFSAHT